MPLYGIITCRSSLADSGFPTGVCQPIITARKQSLGQGNIFRPVCHSVHRGGVPGQVLPPRPGTPPQAGTHTIRTRYIPLGRYPPDQVPPGPGTPRTRYPPDQVHPLRPGTPPDQVHPQTRFPQDQVHPQSSACWEIQATSRWHVSYWNAFLFGKSFLLKTS